MGKLEDYLVYYDKYKPLYGDKFALFYQIGKFHEVYGVDNTQEKCGNVTEIATLLNIKETRTDTSILENNRSNPQMAGFNSVSLDRNVDLLVDQGYTVLVVNQKSNTVPIEREIAYIASPSTNLRGPTDPYIVSIYMDQEWNKKQGIFIRYIGMVAMDITTGKSYTTETNGLPSDLSRADDDLARFLQTYAPVEVLLNYPESMFSIKEVDKMIQGWGYKKANSNNTGYNSLELKPVVFCNIDQVAPGALETCLKGFYPGERCGHLTAVEYVNMSFQPKALHALVYLLRFCHNHNHDFLNCLPVPQSHENEHSLILETSSLLQLDIIDGFYTQRHTVYTHLAKRIYTAMGRRLMRERITNPITDVDILNRRYDDIDAMDRKSRILKPVILASPANIQAEAYYTVAEYIGQHLRSMRDLDRYHRKMMLGSLTPSEFYFLTECYTAHDRLCEGIKDIIAVESVQNDLALIKSQYATCIDLEAAGKCTGLETLESSLFQPGYHAEIDELTTIIKSEDKNVAQLTKIFCEYIGTDGACKYHEPYMTGDHICYFSMSKSAFSKFKKNFNQTSFKTFTLEFSDLTIDDRNKSNVKITIKPVVTLYEKKLTNLNRLRCVTGQVFQTFLKSFIPYAKHLENISRSIAELDVSQGMYRISKEWGYVRPILKTTDSNDASNVVAKGLRHPVIEQRTAYVAQDISLGGDKPTGILLYGVNQTGKSCTMKSLGIAVVLAQAGFYVPATEFHLVPYKNIMTRILSNDNMANGLSTFAVEMTELRSILTRCHGRSLILGDEVCHGTESASAVSLVAASVIYMSAKQSNFIFATHLHELSKLKEITCLENVAQFHLSVSFKNDTIIYDRYMKPGSGLGRYGIEVAKFLKLPADVLHTAYTLRNKYYVLEELPLEASRYNTEFILHKCGVCDSPAVETHHIKFQSEEDMDGFIGKNKMKKNNLHNLVGLCRLHHDMVHLSNKDEELIIFGYNGNNLNYSIRKRLPCLNGNTI